MIFEVCAIISVVIFAFLAYFAIQTLCELKKNLIQVNHVAQDLSHKLKLMDSTFKSISALGDISEVKLNLLREDEIMHNKFGQEKESTNRNNYSEDLAEVVLASLKLGIKLLRR